MQTLTDLHSPAQSSGVPLSRNIISPSPVFFSGPCILPPCSPFRLLIPVFHANRNGRIRAGGSAQHSRPIPSSTVSPVQPAPATGTPSVFVCVCLCVCVSEVCNACSGTSTSVWDARGWCSTISFTGNSWSLLLLIHLRLSFYIERIKTKNTARISHSLMLWTCMHAHRSAHSVIKQMHEK